MRCSKRGANSWAAGKSAAASYCSSAQLVHAPKRCGNPASAVHLPDPIRRRGQIHASRGNVEWSFALCSPHFRDVLSKRVKAFRHPDDRDLPSHRLMKVGAQTRPGFFAQPDVAIDHDDIGLAREFVQDGGDTRQLAPIEVPGLIRQDSLDIGPVPQYRKTTLSGCSLQ